MKRTHPIAITRADSERQADLRSTRRKGIKKTPASSIQRRRNSRLPDFVAPQLATLVDRVPQGEDWLHEIKFDGYRILCRISDGDICLITRNRQDWTERLSFLAQAAKQLPVNQALLDGEVVALNEDGTTNFQLLQNSLSTHASDNLAYYVFDLLHLDGKDLMQLPLLQRKETLAEILKADSSSPAIRYSEHWLGQGDRLYDEACRSGLEGVISKRADQAYRSGRTRDWVKTKCVENRLSFPLFPPVPLPDGPVDLAVEVADAAQRFFWRSGGEWTPAGPELDASVISDEGGRGEHASFTGAFVGMLAFDTSGRAAPADFAHFSYAPM
jgi:bifunctional non-homologous end joining protein LigD